MVSQTELDFLKSHSTPTLESAIALFRIRPRDSGASRPGTIQRFPKLGRVAGYAVTSVFSADAKESYGHRENLAYWEYVRTAPGPKVAVICDSDRETTGPALGKLGAHIHKALGCSGIVTNGGVRDVDAIESIALPVFSASLTLMHGNPHIVNFGSPVVINGLSVQSGDLICADEHGILLVPKETVKHLPEAVAEVERRLDPVLRYCSSPQFSPEGLAQTVARHMKPAGNWTPER